MRVGLEDYAGAGTPTNEELVKGLVSLPAELGRDVASCAEARKVLGLPERAD